MLFKLLRQWSPSSATNSTARSEWTHSTGWGTRIAMGDWHGVRTRYEDDEEGRYERVTAIKLPMNGLSGKWKEQSGEFILLVACVRVYSTDGCSLCLRAVYMVDFGAESRVPLYGVHLGRID